MSQLFNNENFKITAGNCGACGNEFPFDKLKKASICSWELLLCDVCRNQDTFTAYKAASNMIKRDPEDEYRKAAKVLKKQAVKESAARLENILEDGTVGATYGFSKEGKYGWQLYVFAEDEPENLPNEFEGFPVRFKGMPGSS